jgi:putative oxidoreductase
MEGRLGRFAPQIHAITRILAGVMFACHGAQKLFGAFGGVQGEMPAPMLYTAGVIEFFGGLLMAVGLYASWAAFFASGQMAVAYFLAHWPAAGPERFPGQGSFWPILNHGELAVVYCWLFLGFAATGAGTWSLDERMGRGKRAT